MIADRSRAGQLPARGLWWIYLLGAVALIATGAGAGQLAFQLGRPDLSADVIQCWLNHGLVPAAMVKGIDASSPDPVGIDCLREHTSGRVLFSLAGAAAIPAAAWLLMLTDAVTTRRRLTRRGAVSFTSAALTEVETRFDDWCDAAGLEGRRRPELVLGGPGRLTARAHTTAVPFSRPLVVIPAAYAYTEPEQLDLAVLHELAHVRSRDVTWASATWWSGWLNLPVLLLAVSPALFHPTNAPPGFYFGPLWLALVQTAVILLLRAFVLRRREQEADRYAVTVLGGTSALAAAVTAKPSDVEAHGVQNFSPATKLRNFRASARAWLAVHPPAATRVREAAQPADGWQTGFVLATITGLVAMFTFQTFYSVLLGVTIPAWDADGRIALELALMGASVMWAMIQVPLWARSAVPVLGSAPGTICWTTILGSTLGLTSGYLLRSPGSILLVGRAPYSGHLGLTAACLLIVALGVSVLTAGLASTVLPGGRLGLAAAVIGAATLATTGFAVCLELVAQSILFGSGHQRALLLTQGEVRWTGWAPLVLLAAVVLATGANRVAWLEFGPLVRIVLVTGLTGAIVTATLATLRLNGTLSQDGVYLLLVQRVWVCGLCGAVAVLVALLVVRSPIAPALVAGAVVAELVGLTQFARDAVTDGSGRNWHNLAVFARLPIWLLFVVLVVALPAALLLRDLAFGRREPAWRPAAIALVTLTTTTVVALTVLTGAASAVTVAHGDFADNQRPLPTLSPLPAVPAAPESSPVPVTPRAGRALTKAQATAALARMQHRLPAGWASSANNTGLDKGVLPASCAKLFAADRATDEGRAKSAQLTRTYKLPKEKLAPLGAVLVVTLTSYRTPELATQALGDSPRQARECPRWSVPLPLGGRNYYSWKPNRALDLPFPNRPQWLEAKFTAPTYSFVTDDAFGQLVVGRNLASVSVIHNYLGPVMPEDRLAWMQGLRQKVLAEVLAALS